jgi:hypothetical protein
MEPEQTIDLIAELCKRKRRIHWGEFFPAQPDLAVAWPHTVKSVV